MSGNFAKFKGPSLLIACPGDMDYLRASTIKLFRQLQLQIANDQDLDIYDYVTETREAGFKSWTHAQLQIPPPTDAACRAVICFFGERIGTPLSDEVPLDLIASSPALNRTSGPRATRANEPTPAADDTFPLTGSTFEYLAAIEEAQRRRLPVLLLIVAEPAVLTKPLLQARWGNRREVERMRKHFGDDLDAWTEWLRTEYQPQLKSLRTFLNYVSERKADVPFVESGDDALRRVRRFLIEDVGLSDAEHERSPFKGLDPYDVDDWAIFFGRSEWRRGAIAALTALLDRTDEPNLFQIVGGSGSGKSSLMRAGLIGPLCYQDWYGDFVACVVRPHDIGPRGQPAPTTGPEVPVVARLAARALVKIDPQLDLAETEEELGHLSGEYLVSDAVTRLASALERRSRADGHEQRRLIVGVDQFEEIVDAALTPDGERIWGPLLKFMEAAASHPLMVVVCTVQTNRRELMERTGAFAALYGKGVTKEVFAPLEMLDIVKNPFGMRNLKLEPRLEDVLVARIRGLFGSDLHSSVLPLVSLALTRLYSEWERRRSLAPVIQQQQHASSAVRGGQQAAVDALLQDRTAKTFAVAARSQDRRPANGQEPFWDLTYDDYKAFVDIEDAIGKAAEQALEEAKQGASLLWDDDAITGLLRHLVRLTSDNRLSFPSVELTPGTLMRRLAEALSVRRLVAREGPDRFRLVHEAVVQHWKAAKDWLSVEQTLLERFAALKPTAKRWRDSKDRDALLQAVGDLQLQDGAELLAEWPDVLDGPPAPAPGSDEALVRDFTLALLLCRGTPGQEVVTAKKTTRHIHLAAAYGRADIVGRFLAIDPSAAALTRSDGRTALMGACYTGDLDVVRLLLTHGAPVAQPDQDGWLAVHAAAMAGHVECLRLLSQEMTALNAAGPNGVTPLHLAAGAGREGAGRFLLDDLVRQGVAIDSVVDSRGWTPLHSAAASNDASLVRLFLERGADARQPELQGWTPLHLTAAQIGGSGEVARLLLQGGARVEATFGRGYQPLHIAAQNGSESAGTELLDAGASRDATLDNGWTPLHLAVWNNRPAMVRLLVERQAPIELPAFNDWRAIEHTPGSSPTEWTNGGWRALHVAAARGYEGLISLLIELGATVDSINDVGRTPLHVAAAGGHRQAVAVLLAQNADANATDHAGVRPLDISVKDKRFDIARLLVRAGADLEARDSAGRTLLETAVHNGAEAEVTFLLGVMASQTDRRAPQPDLLHAAVERGKREIVAALLDAGADPEAADAFGWRPVHVASQNGYLPILEELAARGANFSARALEPPVTPLQAAAETGQSHCLALIVERGGDLYDEHPDRGSPLYLAVKNGHFVTALQLLDLEVDPRRSDVGRKPSLVDLVEARRARRREVGDPAAADEEQLLERLRRLGYVIPMEPAVARPAEDLAAARQEERWGVPHSLLASLKRTARPRLAQRFDPLEPARGTTDASWQHVVPDFSTWFARRVGVVDGRYSIDPTDTEIVLRALPWYESVRLLRVRRPSWPANLHLFYLVDDRADLFRLAGTSPPIHEVNAKAPVRLSDSNVLDYLRSFCFFVRGEEGAFYVLENPRDPLLATSDADVQSILDSVARPAAYNGLNAQGHFLCSAAISYSNALFTVNFAVQPTGMVEMIDDTPIAADLPIRVHAPLA